MGDSTDAVRCRDCGLLCSRDKYTGMLGEVSEEERASGAFRDSGDPICLALQANLADEAAALKRGRKNLNTLDVITLDRHCGEFFAWKPGFTPKEHKEMLFQLELKKMQDEQRAKDLAREEQRIREEERRHREDLAWREKQAAAEDLRRAEQERKTEERWRSENALQKYSLIIVGILGTIILAAAQIIGSLIQAGWFK